MAINGIFFTIKNIDVVSPVASPCTSRAGQPSAASVPYQASGGQPAAELVVAPRGQVHGVDELEAAAAGSPPRRGSVGMRASAARAWRSRGLIAARIRSDTGRAASATVVSAN